MLLLIPDPQIWIGYGLAIGSALGFCQVIFGKVTLPGTPWTAVDPIVIAPPNSLQVMVLVQWQSGNRWPAAIAA